jgi:hypothetical protein
MRNKRQSSIDWFIEELTKQNMFMNLFTKEIEQAQAMHKKEIMAAYNANFNPFGMEECDTSISEIYYEQFYNKETK